MNIENLSDTELSLAVGNQYKFKSHIRKLVYLGKDGDWHQFARVGRDAVWAELLDSDLHLIEQIALAKA